MIRGETLARHQSNKAQSSSLNKVWNPDLKTKKQTYKAQSLFKKNHPEKHAKKWIDKISQTGFYNMARIDTPNINHPVYAN